MIKLVSDDKNLFEVSHLHDSKLMRIDFGKGCLTIIFQCEEGVFFKISLSNIVLMVGNNIAEENIVLDVAVIDGINVGKDILDKLLPTKTGAQIEYAASIRRRLSNNELLLFEISPSYGGEISIICAALECEKVERPF